MADLEVSSIQSSCFAYPPRPRYTIRRIEGNEENKTVDRQAQIDFILDHYENPRHYGPLENPSVIQKGGNPGCGDVVTFYLRVDGDDRVRRSRSRVTAAPSAWRHRPSSPKCSPAETLAEIEATSSEAILDILGREIAGTRLKCATLGLNTTKEAVRRLRTSG